MGQDVPGASEGHSKVLASLNHAFVISDPNQEDCPIVFASDGFLEMTGYSRDEVLNTNCRFLQGPETDPETVKVLGAAVKNGERCSVRILNYRKDGTSFWNYLTIAPVVNSSGQVIKFVGVQVDVTQQTDGRCAVDDAGIPLLIRSDARLDEKAMAPVGEVTETLQQEEIGQIAAPSDKEAGTPEVPSKRHGVDIKTTIERIQQSFVISDPSLPDCPIVYASDEFLNMSGYAREEVLGRNCRFLQGDKTDAETVRQIRDAIENASEITARLLNYRKDGQPFWNMLTIAPVRGANERVQFFVGVQADVSAYGDKSAQVSEKTAKQISHFLPQVAPNMGDFSAICQGALFPRPHRRMTASFAALEKLVESKTDQSLGADDFHLLRRLGKGDVGEVFVAEVSGHDGTRRHYAIKSVSKDDVAARNKVHRVKTEHRILEQMDHPLIANLFASYQTKSHLMLVSDYWPGGELYQLLQKTGKKRFDEEKTRFYASEVVIALQYLHLHDVIYRDLKPENVLIQGNGHVCLTDFDLSFLTPSSIDAQVHAIEDMPAKNLCAPSSPTWKQVVYAEPLELTNSFVGTEEYLSPEVINAFGHSSGVDWWALGIFIYELLFGTTPFRGRHRDESFSNVLHMDLHIPSQPEISSAASELIRHLVRKQPERRLGVTYGAEEVMRHRFFTSPKGPGGPIHWNLLDCRHHPPPWIPRQSGSKTESE